MTKYAFKHGEEASFVVRGEVNGTETESKPKPEPVPQFFYLFYLNSGLGFR